MANPVHKFTFLNQIGNGGFAQVFAAQLNGTRQKFAIKVISHNQEIPNGYQHEINLNLRLEHPHILPVYDYWIDSDTTYMLMPLMSAGNLNHHLLIHEHLSVEESCKILMQLASALEYLHQQNIVHLDVKPDNILLDEAGNIYLSDFGIARDLAMPYLEQENILFLGSPRYVAPEQLRREAVTHRCDIYSLGLLAYQLLTGFVPYESRDLKALCKQQLFQPVPALQSKLPHLPLELNIPIAKASRKDPAERYASVCDFAEEFYEIATKSASLA